MTSDDAIGHTQRKSNACDYKANFKSYFSDDTQLFIDKIRVQIARTDYRVKGYNQSPLGDKRRKFAPFCALRLKRFQSI